MIFKSFKALTIIARLAPRRRVVFDLDADRESDFVGQFNARARHFECDAVYKRTGVVFHSKNRCARKTRTRASTTDREVCVCVCVLCVRARVCVYVCIYIFISGLFSRGVTIPCVAWLERHQVHLDVSLRQTAIRSSDTKRYARY